MELEEAQRRHTPEVQRAISTIYVRLQGFNFQFTVVIRTELESSLERCCGSQLMTLSTPPQQLMNQLATEGRNQKQPVSSHTKLLLNASKAPQTCWPLAVCHASEVRFRKVLQSTPSTERLNSASRHRPSKSMDLRRAASGLVKVICRTADSRPGGKGQKPGKTEEERRPPGEFQ